MATVATMARCMAINQQLSIFSKLTVADLKLLKVCVCVCVCVRVCVCSGVGTGGAAAPPIF